MNSAIIKEIVKNDDYLKEKLFFRGFLITDNKEIQCNHYPFFGNWNVIMLNRYFQVMAHKKLPVYTKGIQDDVSLGILGHAYNPFSGATSESEILTQLADVYSIKEEFFNIVNQLTGVFCLFLVDGAKIKVLSDAVGLKSVFYGKIDGSIYISSHVNLIADLTGLREDPRVTKLKKAITFKYFGNQLPGNITTFSEVKRLNPNHYATNETESITQVRFYTPKSGTNNVDEACQSLIPIMTRTMELIAEKWKRPAISLTGGCDSKTTLASAKNVYDKYSYFSYDSQLSERTDALAAKKICEHLGASHILYNIPYDDESFEDIEGVRAVLLWNGGNVRYNNPNDVRKRAYLDKCDDFDVEVKSWASEVGRARYSKRYSGRSFGKPSARKCTTFYKFLFFSRSAVRMCDRWFKEYLELYMVQDSEMPIPWQDQFYWEWHWPSRDGVNLTAEQEYSNEITVPFNNRLVLELLLSVSEEDRINDSIYTKIRQTLDPRIDEAAEAVVNVNHTGLRAKLEGLYYTLNTLLPF